MANRLRSRLAQARIEHRGVMLGFLPAGYPDPERFLASAGAAFEAGLDALEVSMPGPAPELDGPLIQAAAVQASRHLDSIAEALELAARARRLPDDSLIALAYASTLESTPVEELLDELAAADIDGILLPQHSVREQLAIGLLARERDIEPVIFVHLQEDLGVIAASDLEHPLIYLQSAALRTGDPFNAEKAIERLGELAEALAGRRYSVCVGFGVRDHDDVARLMNAGADGAIIGTRLVKAADDGPQSVIGIVDEVASALVRRRVER
jgi:tryptophan synthase alpha chain